MLCTVRRGARYLGVHCNVTKPQHISRNCSKMSNSSHTKDHKSAVCIIPPRPVWDAIQEIRLFNDKGFVRCGSTPIGIYLTTAVSRKRPDTLE